jgi:LysM repeat protein
MRRLSLICIVLMMFSYGCAGKPGPEITGGVDSRNASLKMGIESFEKGLNAQEAGDREAARLAFMEACKHLAQVDDQRREVMNQAIASLKKIVEASGFEYAPRESFSALLLYMKMQNARTEMNDEGFAALEKQFTESVQKSMETTAQAKQKRIEVLSQDIAQKRDEIKKPAAPPAEAPAENYPSRYVVKKNDTLPAIAARHDIYNDSFMWPLIYKANRDQIKDPKVVYVGQDLKIPRDMNNEEIIEARRGSWSARSREDPQGCIYSEEEIGQMPQAGLLPHAWANTRKEKRGTLNGNRNEDNFHRGKAECACRPCHPFHRGRRRGPGHLEGGSGGFRRGSGKGLRREAEGRVDGGAGWTEGLRYNRELASR